MEWKDQYKHPNWQRKRLEALENVEYTCQRCYDNESQLHVHHKQYIKGRMIWDYQVGELSVLCESCHEATHKEISELKSLISEIHPEGISEICSLISGYMMSAIGPSGIGSEEAAKKWLYEHREEKWTRIHGLIGAIAALISGRFIYEKDLLEIHDKLIAGYSEDVVVIPFPLKTAIKQIES